MCVRVCEVKDLAVTEEGEGTEGKDRDGGRPTVSFSRDGWYYLMSRVSTGLTLQLEANNMSDYTRGVKEEREADQEMISSSICSWKSS